MVKQVFRAGAPAVGLLAAALVLSGCLSSSFGGGSSAPRNGTVALPPGTRLVCTDGTNPPCH
jgi:hypothetical protein